MHQQQKSKQIYEAQKKTEKMSVAESEELAVRKRKIVFNPNVFYSKFIMFNVSHTIYILFNPKT